LIVDGFAGGGGTSVGIEWALRRSPDIAINHDAEAIAMHRANHPHTKHYVEDIRRLNPVEVCSGHRVGLAWFSPDCTYHSKARGGKPFRDRNLANRIRGLAWIVTEWARLVRPRVIIVENVEEFQEWGPLLDDGRPCPIRRGLTYRRWRKQLQNLGYVVEERELSAHHFGAPTTRTRLFVVARRDGHPIVWPAPTHGPGLLPYRTAAECIDWSLPTYSIFMSAAEAKRYGVKRPLAHNTLRRIARGIQKYVIEASEPFIVRCNHGGDEWRGFGAGEQFPTLTASRDAYGLVIPAVASLYSERHRGEARMAAVRQPLPVVTSRPRHALVAALLAKHYAGHDTPGTSLRSPASTITARDHHALIASHLLKLKGTCRDGQSLRAPLHTIGAQGNHYAEVRALLIKFYSSGGQWNALSDPMPTVPTKDRIGLVTVHGEDYVITDIGMRMLTPPELFRAQGFPADYVIAPECWRVVAGRHVFARLPVQTQTAMCGNSVSPYHAQAMVGAQFGVKRMEVAA
jgi:DNA (cytosine-5)-methyltransferase 1